MKTLFVSLLFVSSLIGQPRQLGQQLCKPESEEAILSLLNEDITEAHLQLYVLSVASKSTTSIDNENLRRIAEGTVFALSNQFSLLATSYQLCLPHFNLLYNAVSSDTNRFMTALVETYTIEDWSKAIFEEWQLKDVAPLIGHLVTNPETRGKKLQLHPAIESALNDYAKLGQSVDLTDARQVAALELLGQKLDWKAEDFKLVRLALVNNNNIWLRQRFLLTDDRLELRGKNFSERLAFLADFYEK